MELPKPKFSMVLLSRYISAHDGDDRGGRLKLALEGILEARELARDHQDFIAQVDEVLDRLRESFEEGT